METKWKVPIHIELFLCRLTSLGFEKTQQAIKYELGSGPFISALPKVKQEPDCGETFDNI